MIKRIKKIIPYLLNPSHSRDFPRGSKPLTIANPSRGWIGIRLKSPRMTFMEIKGTKRIDPIIKKLERLKKMNNLSTIDSVTASNKFDAGPAKEIRAPSFRGFFRLKGSNCTGLPQPKPKKRRNMAPYRSICTSGFRDIL